MDVRLISESGVRRGGVADLAGRLADYLEGAITLTRPGPKRTFRTSHAVVTVRADPLVSGIVNGGRTLQGIAYPGVEIGLLRGSRCAV